MAELLLKCIRSSASKMNFLLGTRSLCILLGLVMMGDLITATQPACSGCSALSAYPSSFTIRNSLPQSDSNLQMVCSIWYDCGEFTMTPPKDIPCNGLDVGISEPSTCSCASPASAAVSQVVCEFTWTRPTSEIFYRTQVMVWSGETAAPNKTYLLIDGTYFWFSTAPDGPLTNIGAWGAWNYLSSEGYIMNNTAGKVKGFGRSHCRTSA